MSRPASFPTTPQPYRVSERDLTEIELHSVDSINDLHRMMYPEHSHRGLRPPFPPAHSPTPNGKLHSQGVKAVNQTGQPISSKWPKSLQEVLRAGPSRAYAMTCGVILLLLLSVMLIFCFLVQQGGALQVLTEAVREKQDVSMEISQLIQELQALRHNLTALRDRP